MFCENPFGPSFEPLELPEHAAILTMREHDALPDPQSAVRDALHHPTAGPSLGEIAARKKRAKPNATAVIVVSDNTRPVPYKGAGNILVPLIETLQEAGYAYEDMTVLIATGMHHAMDEAEQRAMLDPYVFEHGIPVLNHDAKDASLLTDLGTTARGSRIMIDSRYVGADLKIVTGLIESHFMAGASGGRKAICPGLISEESTRVFHGPALMADERSTNLVLAGNPVHEESLAFARAAGIDFLLNVTLNRRFEITGVFAGDFERAHEDGVAFIREEVAVPGRAADIVITHGGYVGLNHYQCGKCAVAGLGILKPGGYMVILGHIRDSKDPVGSLPYKTCLSLLTTVGAAKYLKLICSPDWTFLPDQWQVQQWGKLFARTTPDHLVFYAPELDTGDFEGLPGHVLPKGLGYAAALQEALAYIAARENRPIETMTISFIADGPYAVPFDKEEKA